MEKRNLFADIPVHLPQEWSQTLFAHPHLTIERIVSKGHASPQGFWYDQDWDEWVLLLKGRAGVRFENEPEIITLGPGEAVLIPAHVKHRVQWTDPAEETIWLAVHAKAEKEMLNG
ncbi:MAG: cupin domain-containing protein [Desulfobacteraceae bacterium]|nr:cupin domain-containing protein [Desulfobacteraceae bacterium]